MREYWRRVRLWMVGFLLLGAVGTWFSLPNVSYLRTQNPVTTAYIELYKSRAMARGKKPVIMMRWVPITEISPHLQNAVVVSEDDMFFRHHGVDWDAMREALRYDWQRWKIARGGSTITQQVARNLFLYPTRSPLRKVREMLIAWKLERTLTKKRILEIYLNIAEWGVGVYGAQAASQIYFGKDAAQLTPEESIELASALPSPWRLNPAKNPTPKLLARREVILERMQKLGYLPEAVNVLEIDVPGDAPLNELGEPIESTGNARAVSGADVRGPENPSAKKGKQSPDTPIVIQ